MMPRKDYKSTGFSTLPEEIVKAVNRLIEDKKFQAEMKARGYARITKSLVYRIAILEFLESKGYSRDQIFAVEGK